MGLADPHASASHFTAMNSTLRGKDSTVESIREDRVVQGFNLHQTLHLKPADEMEKVGHPVLFSQAGGLRGPVNHPLQRTGPYLRFTSTKHVCH